MVEVAAGGGDAGVAELPRDQADIGSLESRPPDLLCRVVSRLRFLLARMRLSGEPAGGRARVIRGFFNVAVAMKMLQNQAELAGFLGIRKRSLQRLLARADWPVGKHAPWSANDAREARRWRREALQNPNSRGRDSTDVELDTALDRELMEARVDLARARGDKLRAENEKLREQYMPWEQVDGMLGGLAFVFLRILDEIEATWPGRFGIDRAEVGRLVASYRRRVIDQAELELRRLSDARDETLRAGRARR